MWLPAMGSPPWVATLCNLLSFSIVSFVIGCSDFGVEMNTRVEEVYVRLDMLGNAVLVASNVTSACFAVFKDMVLCLEELLGFKRSRL